MYRVLYACIEPGAYYRLIRSVSTDFNACKFVAGIVWCGGFIVSEKSLHKPYLAFKHTSLLDYKTWLSRHVFN